MLKNKNNSINKNPNKNPNKLKINSMRLGKDKKLWKVIRDNDSKYYKKKWIHASKYDVKCYNELKLSISKNIKKFQNKEIKTKKQAIAIAYSYVKKKYPKCIFSKK